MSLPGKPADITLHKSGSLSWYLRLTPISVWIFIVLKFTIS